MTPDSRAYDIWMPLAMIALVVIAAVSVLTFVVENVQHDGVAMCPVIQRIGEPPEMKPCWLVNPERNDNE